MEIWKIIETFPKIMISNLGNVKHTNGKSKYKGINKQGYYYIVITMQKKRYTLKMHRLVAEYFLPPPRDELVVECSKQHHGKVCVNHKDANKLNNCVDNLEWCSHLYNNSHARENNLIPALKGSLNGRATISEETVHLVCKLFEQGASVKEVMSVCGISRQQATKIRCGIAWKHIRCNYNIKVKTRYTY